MATGQSGSSKDSGAASIVRGLAKPGVVSFDGMDSVHDRMQAIIDARATGFSGKGGSSVPEDMTIEELHELATSSPAQLLAMGSNRSIMESPDGKSVAGHQSHEVMGDAQASKPRPRVGSSQGHTREVKPRGLASGMHSGALRLSSVNDDEETEDDEDRTDVASTAQGAAPQGLENSTGKALSGPNRQATGEDESRGLSPQGRKFRVAVAVEDKPGLLLADAAGSDSGSDSVGSRSDGLAVPGQEHGMLGAFARHRRASVGSVGAKAMAERIDELSDDWQTAEEQAQEAAMAFRSHRRAEKVASRRLLLQEQQNTTPDADSGVSGGHGPGKQPWRGAKGGDAGVAVAAKPGKASRPAGRSHALSRLRTAGRRVQDANRVSKVQPPLKPACLLNKNSSLMRIWDMAMIALLVFTALFTPYEVSFINSIFLDEWFWINRTVDIGFLIDLVFNFFLPYRDPETRREVMDHRHIAWNYATGWLALDFISIFPFDVVFEAAGGGADSASRLRIVKVIRLLKLAKLLRVVRASRIVTRWRARVGLSFSVVQLVSFLVYVLLLAHWSACAFYLVGSLTFEPTGTATSWVVEEGVLDKPYEAYVASLYFSTMTTTTIGYGDISPQNPSERLFTIFLMIMGGGLYAYVIGAIGSIVARFDGATAEHRENMDQLNRYTQELDLPQQLREELRDYFSQTLSIQRERYYSHLLTFMSPKLRGRVAMHRHGAWISHVPFFNVGNAHERLAFVTAVAMELQPAVYSKLERVMYAGQTISRMFIIQKGLATVQGRIVSRGHFFGEEAILTEARAIATVRALTFLDVFFLTKESLMRILDSGDFAETRKKIRYAVIRMALRRELLKCAALARIQNGLFRIANGGELAYAPDPTAEVALDDHTAASERTPSSKDKGQQSARRGGSRGSGSRQTAQRSVEKGSAAGTVGRPPSPPPAPLLALARNASEHRSRRTSLDVASSRESARAGEPHGSGGGTSRDETESDKPKHALPVLVGGKASAEGFTPSARGGAGKSGAQGGGGFPLSPSTMGTGNVSSALAGEHVGASSAREGDSSAAASAGSSEARSGLVGFGPGAAAAAAASAADSQNQDTPVAQLPSTVSMYQRPNKGPGNQKRLIQSSVSSRAISASQRESFAHDARRMTSRMPLLARQMSRAAMAKVSSRIIPTAPDDLATKPKDQRPARLHGPAFDASDGSTSGSRMEQAISPAGGHHARSPSGGGFVSLADAAVGVAAKTPTVAMRASGTYDRGLMQRILNKSSQVHTASADMAAQVTALADSVRTMEQLVTSTSSKVQMSQYMSAIAILLVVVVLIVLSVRPAA